MNKRGQIALVILILSIILISSLIFLLLIRKPIKEKKVKEIVQLTYKKEIEDFVRSCLEKSSKESLLFLAKQGFYIQPEDYVFTGVLKVPYYRKGEQNLIPSIDFIQSQLAEYINETINNCLNFTSFKNKGTLVVPIFRKDIKVNIKNDFIHVNMKYPLKLYEGNKTTIIENFYIGFEARINYMFDKIKEFLNSYDPLFFDTRINEGDLSFDFALYNNTEIYFISDEAKKIDNETLIILFAIK